MGDRDEDLSSFTLSGSFSAVAAVADSGRRVSNAMCQS